MIWFLLSWSHNRSKTLARNPKYGYLKRRLSSRGSFGLNSARGSKETTTIERTHPTLVIARSPCRGLKMIAVVRERRKRTRRTFQGNNLWKSTTLRTPGNLGFTVDFQNLFPLGSVGNVPACLCPWFTDILYSMIMTDRPSFPGTRLNSIPCFNLLSLFLFFAKIENWFWE